MTREQFYAAPYKNNAATWERLAEVAHDAIQDAPSHALEQDVVEAKVDLELDALLASRALAHRLSDIIVNREESNAN